MINLKGNVVLAEVLNGITHGLGVLFVIPAFPVMLSVASACSTKNFVAIVAYLIALLTMFVSSTLYHSFYCLDTAAKVFRILDKSAIYLLISGTYTPLLVTATITNLAFSELCAVRR